jgi:2C-methyl-D-erythritol 2,4-cyclodiphosphate synthase
MTTVSAPEKDLWADETTGREVVSEPVATTRTDHGLRADSDSPVAAASIMDAVAAAEASSDGGQQVLQESETALNARVRALQLENARLEEEFRQQSVTSEAQQSR